MDTGDQKNRGEREPARSADARSVKADPREADADGRAVVADAREVNADAWKPGRT